MLFFSLAWWRSNWAKLFFLTFGQSVVEASTAHRSNGPRTQHSSLPLTPLNQPTNHSKQQHTTTHMANFVAARLTTTNNGKTIIMGKPRLLYFSCFFRSYDRSSMQAAGRRRKGKIYERGCVCVWQYFRNARGEEKKWASCVSIGADGVMVS